MTLFLRTPFHIPAVLLSVCCAVVSQLCPAEEASPRHRLEDRTAKGDVSQVECVVEFSGQLKINPDGKKLTNLPIVAKGELQFVETITEAGNFSDATSNQPRRAMRYYQTASVVSRVGETSVTNKLEEEHRLIGVQAANAEVLVYAPQSPLTRDELELVDIQGNSLLLGRLLPGREVTIGETWRHDDPLVAALFKLDVVTENDLSSKFVRTEGETAFLEMSGHVEGSVGGVASELTVAAKYQVQLATGRIAWLAMSIQEDRAVGHAEPGFNVTARIRMASSPGKLVPELRPEVLEQLPQQPAGGLAMLSFYSPAAGVRFLHERNWKVMIDRHDVSVLRLIERGDLIAQCNISRLADAAPEKQLNMASFQSDIRRVLDKNFGQIVDASEAKSDQGVRILRTIVAGVAADLPIQWNYYHLTDAEGRQASLVFTMDAKLVERFGAADQALIASFQFTGPPAAQGATPAGTTAAVPSKSSSTAR